MLLSTSNPKALADRSDNVPQESLPDLSHRLIVEVLTHDGNVGISHRMRIGRGPGG
jgi:hypothetical protein